MCEIKEVVLHQQQERHHRLLSLLDHSLHHLLLPIRNMLYIHHNILFFN
uniref:Uncharacterized protein n=1 Tax=Rhodnius prolixus TaxID=13249 RepID=T1HVF3_RHOPR